MRRLLVVAVLALGCGDNQARRTGRPDGGAPDRDVDALTFPLADWPLVLPGVESRQFSSFDRAGGNDDGFNGTYSTLYRDDRGGYVIFDAVGPGRLDTLWFTSGVGGHAPLDLGAIRFFFDDEAEPRAEIEANALFSGTAEGFPPELVFDNARSTGGFVSWVPVPFAHRLRIATEKRPYFYSAQYQTFPPDAALTSWTPGSVPVDWAAAFRTPAGAAPPFEEVPLDLARTGAGTIGALRFEPATPPAPAALHAARIVIAWDGEATPSVDVPLDTFFGSGLGATAVDAIAFTMSPGGYENRFPMPYWSGFHLTITGMAGRLWVWLDDSRYLQARAGTLHARYVEALPAAGSDDFEYLAATGAGKLVATVLTVAPPDPAADKQWWEGDLRSYADGRRTPGIHGTGHEDDHFGGWSNEFFDGPFTLPMHGEPAAEILDRNGQSNGNVTMYRLWPGIPFLGEIRHSVEHGSENGRVARYAATTFYYATGASWLTDSDGFSLCDDAARAAHAYQAADETEAATLESAFEGRDYLTPIALCHRAHRGPAAFTATVAPGNEGVYLRRTFDQLVGGQRARISVDGVPVGVWYTAEQNGARRWAERDLFIPAAFVAGKTAVTIEIAPEASPPWDAAAYRVLSVTPR